jgi:hypothetical protein
VPPACPEQPDVFSIGVNNGGVWRSSDDGLIWKPLFDDQQTGSVGAVVVASSDPNFLCAGSGEGRQQRTCPAATGCTTTLAKQYLSAGRRRLSAP